MIARTRAVVEPGGRLVELSCQPPLTLRRVRSDDDGECVLCLVGTGAGPLAGDRLALELEVLPDARARLIATGASLAQGRGTGPAAQVSLHVIVGEDAVLVAAPGPLIVAEGGAVDVHLDISLGIGARLDWRELVVLGRGSDRRPGRARIRWDVTRAGRPLLRQLVDLTDSALAGWPRAQHRVLATALVADPNRTARTRVDSPTAVAQVLADGSLLATVLAEDAHDALRRLDALTRAGQTSGATSRACS
jgi:urease accessory protein